MIPSHACLKQVLTAKSSPTRVARLSGGKGRSLYELSKRGIRQPPWAILSAAVFEHHAEQQGIAGRVRQLVGQLSDDNFHELSQQLQETVLSAALCADVSRHIEAAYAEVGHGSVAVRSSAGDEDGAKLSFAGQYSTFLNVSGGRSVAECTVRCWASSFSARSLKYRLGHHAPIHPFNMAVIIQAMVMPETSGVLFTANPMSGRFDEMMISAVYGLGEGLVSGAIDADAIVIERSTAAIKDSVVGEKAERCAPAPEGGWILQAVPEAAREGLALSTEQIRQLHGIALEVESVFRCVQDIEWAIMGEQVYILQSRPITTLPQHRVPDGPSHIWDNSNIIESYGGVTCPMTYSFARHVYNEVYREYCRLLGVPQRHLVLMEDWLRAMLGHHHGYVYYNLLNWYKVIRLVPFYEVNRRILELSMGLDEALDVETAESLWPYEPRHRVEGWWLRTKIAVTFAWHYLTIERSVQGFVQYFYALYDEHDALDYTSMSAEQAFGHFLDLKRRFLRDWGRMILLEQVIGLSIGLLDTLTKRWMPDAPEGLLFLLVKPEDDLESLAPSRRLRELAEFVAKDVDLQRMLQERSPSEMYEALLRSCYTSTDEFLAEVDRYIGDFGYRSLNELKLEEPDLKQDPSVLFSMLKSVLPQVDQGRQSSRKGLDIEAEGYVGRLSGPKRWFYRLVRAKARRSLSAREQVRFCRTRAFGLTRRVLTAIGEDLARGGVLANPRDLFMLRMEELIAWFDGTLPGAEIPALVEMRRAKSVEYGELRAPGRFKTRGLADGEQLRAAGWNGTRAEGGETTTPVVPELMRGTPCCPGIAEAEARVVDAPLDAGGKILVTYRTDPGWCAVLESASALLIERGSPLTHVAIVARELNVPTVMQIKDLTQRVRSGMRLRVDGGTGVVTLCAASPALGDSMAQDAGANSQ